MIQAVFNELVFERQGISISSRKLKQWLILLESVMQIPNQYSCRWRVEAHRAQFHWKTPTRSQVLWEIICSCDLLVKDTGGDLVMTSTRLLTLECYVLKLWRDPKQGRCSPPCHHPPWWSRIPSGRWAWWEALAVIAKTIPCIINIFNQCRWDVR